MFFSPDSVDSPAAGSQTEGDAKIGKIDASAINIPDTKFNSVRPRGIGEIGITGTSATAVNAIFHATRKRVRGLPITPDKLL